MSASDERKLDEAIELANEFAQLSSEQQKSPRSAEPRSSSNSLERGLGAESGNSSSASSPRLKAMFSGLGKKRDKSPKTEKKSYSEEIANVSDVGEELTPEAQEAYNMLVGQPQQPLKPRRTLISEEDSTRKERKNNNANIRAPQGIPGRGAAAKQDSDSGIVDSNPLRRLRESSFIPSKPKPKPKPNTDVNGSKITTNTSFFDKLKEQEATRQEVIDPTTGNNDKPAPPPRNPLRASTINQKPRERKNPLDLTGYKHRTPVVMSSTTEQILKSNLSSATSRDSEDSAFNTESDASSNASGSGGVGVSATKPQRPKSNDSFQGYFTTSSQQPQQPTVTPTTVTAPQYPVKAVKLSAADLGLGDSGDTFWSERVDFEEMSGGGGGGRGDSIDGSIPRMLGRYRTSDTVSYEDLLDFALDDEAGGTSGGGGDQEEEDEECFLKGVER